MFLLPVGNVYTNINTKISFGRNKNINSQPIKLHYENDYVSFTALKHEKSLREIETIPFISKKNLLNDIKGDKKPVIFLDFDGVLSFITPNPYDAKVHNQKLFLDVLKKAEKSNIPVFILTGRQTSDFNVIFNGKIPSSLNLIGIYGNEFNISAPKSKKTKTLIEYCREQEGYKTTVIRDKDPKKVRIIFHPKIEETPEKKKLISEIEELAKIGFSVENKYSSSFFMKWGEMSTKAQNSSSDKPFEVKEPLSENFFNKLENWLLSNQSVKSEDSRYLKLKSKNSKKELIVPLDKIVQFGQETLKGNATKIFNLPYEPKHKSVPSEMCFEIYNPENVRINKGMILEKIAGLYENPLPIFFGDSLSEGKADEFAIEAASKTGGIGIGVIENGQYNGSRFEMVKSKKTTANYLSKSFEDTAFYLNEIINIYREKSRLKS